MGKPRWQNNPKWHLLGNLVVAVASIAWMASWWAVGRRTPDAEAALRFGVGFVAGLLLLLPDYVQYRRGGDSYLRRMLTNGMTLAHYTGRSAWYILYGMLLWLAFFSLGRLHPVAIVGLGLGAALWYPYVRDTWKRMWELYEQDQSAAPPSAEGVPSAPEAR